MEHNTQSSQSEDSTLRQLGQTIQTEVEVVRSTAKDYEEQIEAFVRERPVAAVFGALGLGFIVARIFSRR
jgi:ElaB/YqjD/DUF883 family membrane-anchored ribosome-binding protein